MDAGRLHREDELRRLKRQATELPLGRPILQKTRARRDRLQEAFAAWWRICDCTWELLVKRSRKDADYANEVLIAFGRYLYQEGKPHYHYAETIKLCSAECPQIRRLLQPSWDLAFSWLRQEPPEHHLAMPWQVAIALVTVALLYGWTAAAGVIALCWGGLARVGEAVGARRADLVLPEDTGQDVGFALLAVKEPKTRFKAARHQSLRVDQPQLLRVLQLAFSKLGPTDKLWPYSPSTMRSHFQKLLSAIGLKANAIPGLRDLDMGSLRAGGATWLMQCTENPDYVRRRGRWITTRVMEIYIQEISSITFLPRLDAELRSPIFTVANFFEEMLTTAERWQRWNYPTSTWHFLVCHGASDA